MSVYFLDNLEKCTAPEKLPCESAEDPPSQIKDILEEVDRSRKVSEYFGRNLVACSRSLRACANLELQRFRFQQGLQLLWRDKVMDQKDKIRLAEIQSVRALGCSATLQDTLLAEKSKAQEALCSLNEFFEKNTQKLRNQIQKDSVNVEYLRGIEKSLQKELKTPLRKFEICSYDVSRKTNSFQKFEGINDVTDLVSFLRTECALDLLDPCLDNNITSIKSLCALESKDVQRLRLSEQLSARLISFISITRAGIKMNGAKDALLCEHGCLFRHRTDNSVSSQTIYAQLKSYMFQNNLNLFQSTLISTSANVLNYQDVDGWTLLHRAASRSGTIWSGDSVSPGEYQAQPPQSLAVDFLCCLIRHKADVHLKNIYGRTALHYAAMEGSVESCQVLIDAGAHATEQDRNGMTPLQHVLLMRKGCWEQARILLGSHMPIAQTRLKLKRIKNKTKK